MTDDLKHEHRSVPKHERNNNKRRKLLKTTGITTGLAVGAVWHKPILRSVVTPAHAQTSNTTTTTTTTTAGPVTTIITGSTSGSDPFAKLVNGSESDSIAAKVMDAVVPTAHAAVPSITMISSALLSETVADYQHCVSISVTAAAGMDPSSAVITVDGPEIYYGYTGYSGGTYYYGSTVNFSGSSTATLTPNGNVYDFEVTINGLEVCGEIDNTLTGAKGTFIYVGSPYVSIQPVGSPAFNYSSELVNGGGYGAYWETGAGAQCVPGSGPADPVARGGSA